MAKLIRERTMTPFFSDWKPFSFSPNKGKKKRAIDRLDDGKGYGKKEIMW